MEPTLKTILLAAFLLNTSLLSISCQAESELSEEEVVITTKLAANLAREPEFLIFAAEQEDAEMISYILKIGADINAATSPANETALMRAASLGKLRSVELLLENNADQACVNKEGKTAFDLASTDEIKALLHEAGNTSQ